MLEIGTNTGQDEYQHHDEDCYCICSELDHIACSCLTTAREVVDTEEGYEYEDEE